MAAVQEPMVELGREVHQLPSLLHVDLVPQHPGEAVVRVGRLLLLGAGVVNKKVLEGCGIDSNVYSGLAFGIGIDRIAMLKYGINNIKLLFESDLRVLDQIDD